MALPEEPRDCFCIFGGFMIPVHYHNTTVTVLVIYCRVPIDDDNPNEVGHFCQFDAKTAQVNDTKSPDETGVQDAYEFVPIQRTSTTKQGAYTKCHEPHLTHADPTFIKLSQKGRDHPDESGKPLSRHNYSNQSEEIIGNKTETVRRDLEMTDHHEVAKSIKSGFSSVEVLRSYIPSQMEQLKNMKVDGKKKNSIKNEIEKQLREKEAPIKSQLSKDYMKHVCDPMHFRPEVAIHIVFPAGLREFLQRMEQGPISQEISMTFEWLRLVSLSSYSGSGSAIQLARSGFFHDPEHGPLATRCHACNLLYTNWEYFDNVEETHRRLSPNCPLMRDDGSTTGNVSIDNLAERTAPEVAVEEAENRNSADSESQAQATAAVSDIAENREMIPGGLPQHPTDDRNNYEYTSRSSPSTVSGHGSTPGGAVGSARSSPSATGGYTAISQDSNNTAVGASSSVTAPANTPPDPLTTPAAAVLIEKGYTRVRVRVAILAVRRSTGHNSVNAEQVLKWILDQDVRVESSTPDTRSLKEEYQKLLKSVTCTICMDNRVNITYLPCGHLVCCETCAPLLRKCPICRKRIEGSVKTFMP